MLSVIIDQVLEYSNTFFLFFVKFLIGILVGRGPKYLVFFVLKFYPIFFLTVLSRSDWRSSTLSALQSHDLLPKAMYW